MKTLETRCTHCKGNGYLKSYTTVCSMCNGTGDGYFYGKDKCEVCSGKGKELINKPECNTCSGIGYIPTEYGRKTLRSRSLVKFILRHAHV